MEETLDRADQRLTAILDSLYIGAMIIDPEDHVIVYLNSEAAKLMEREIDDVVGRVCHDYVCPAHAGKCPITDLNQVVDNSEKCVLNPAEERVPILKTVKKIIFRGREHLLESFLDISAVKEKEKVDGVLEMAGAAAHHLSQPIQILITCSELLQKRADSDNIKELADIIRNAVFDLRDLIRKIQSITTYESQEYVEGKRIVDIDKASGNGLDFD